MAAWPPGPYAVSFPPGPTAVSFPPGPTAVSFPPGPNQVPGTSPRPINGGTVRMAGGRLPLSRVAI